MGDELFDQIKQVWEGSDKITTKTKPASVFMTMQYISLNKDGIVAAGALNRLGSTLPGWFSLPFLKYTVVRGPAPRDAYPKGLEKPLTKKQKVAVKLICDKFCVGEEHALQIKEILEAQGVVTGG